MNLLTGSKKLLKRDLDLGKAVDGRTKLLKRDLGLGKPADKGVKKKQEEPRIC